MTAVLAAAVVNKDELIQSGNHRLLGCIHFISLFFYQVPPVVITPNCKAQKNDVLKAGQCVSFHKVQGDGDDVTDDPPGPVFEFSSGH